jgi:hypothetical protein
MGANYQQRHPVNEIIIQPIDPNDTTINPTKDDYAAVNILLRQNCEYHTTAIIYYYNPRTVSLSFEPRQNGRLNPFGIASITFDLDGGPVEHLDHAYEPGDAFLRMRNRDVTGKVWAG